MWRWFVVVAGAMVMSGCGASNVGKVEKTTVPLTAPPPPPKPVKSTLPVTGEANKGGAAKPGSGQSKAATPPPSKLGLTPPKN
jgi:hypothetical protein